MKEFDNIDDYLLGLLSEADERAFLERVAQDQALAQQLAQRQKLIRGIQHKGRRALKAELETFHQQHQPQAAAPRPRRLLLGLAAAAAALLLLLWIWQSQSAHSPQRLYAQYYQAYDFPTALRQGDPQLSDRAFQYYEAGQYAEALPLFETALQNQPDRPIWELALAFCQLETGQTAAARSHFEKIYRAQTPLLEEQAAWYLALLALRNGESDRAREYLAPLAADPQADHHREAQSLLEQLD